MPLPLSGEYGRESLSLPTFARAYNKVRSVKDYFFPFDMNKAFELGADENADFTFKGGYGRYRVSLM